MFKKSFCFAIVALLVMAHVSSAMACYNDYGYDDGCGYYYDYSYDCSYDYSYVDDDCGYDSYNCGYYDDCYYDDYCDDYYDYDISYALNYNITNITDSNTYYYNITYNTYYGDVVYATNYYDYDVYDVDYNYDYNYNYYDVDYNSYDTYNTYNTYSYGNVLCDANLRDCYGNIIGAVCAGSNVEVVGPCEWDCSRVDVSDYSTGCSGSILASTISDYSCGYQENTCSFDQYVDSYDYTGTYGSADTWACDDRSWLRENCGGGESYSSPCEYAWANTPEGSCR